MQFRTLRAELPQLSVVGADHGGVEAMLQAMSEQPTPPDIELPLSQPYSTEFIIGGARGRSGAVLMRSGSFAASELSTALVG